MKRTSLALGLALGISLLGLPGIAHAQPLPTEHLLDGASFRYFYQNGWGLRMSFSAGRVSYEWIAGPPTGNGKVGVPYRSRKIGRRQYLVTFRDLEDRRSGDFVVLVLDFDNNTMAGSALLDYGSDRERIDFQGGIIEGVRWERGKQRAR